jgi:hypothetical protein
MSEELCRYCGNTYEQHNEDDAPDARMMCLGKKKGFRPRKSVIELGKDPNKQERARIMKARHARTRETEILDARFCVATQIRKLTCVLADLNMLLDPAWPQDWNHGLAQAKAHCEQALVMLISAETQYGDLVPCPKNTT